MGVGLDLLHCLADSSSGGGVTINIKLVVISSHFF